MPTRRKFTYVDEVWNVAHGCTPISAGCDNCWAQGMACRQRNASTKRGSWSGEIVTFPERLSLPLRWRKPRVIAVQFMGDLFHPSMPPEFIAAVFGVMAAYPQHTFMLLTKRPEVMHDWFDWIEGIIVTVRPSCPEQQPVKLAIDPVYCCEMAAGKHGVRFSPRLPGKPPWPLPNVWIGISAEDQPTLEERWKHLRNVPAAKRWLSYEPALGDIRLSYEMLTGLDEEYPEEGVGAKLDWIVVGAESGPRARPCPTEWIQAVVDQCLEAEVAVHVKQVQLGSDGCDLECCRRRVSSNPKEWPAPLRVREWPEVC